MTSLDQRETSNDRLFVESMYRALLMREPDPAGMASYIEVLQSGGKRAQIIAAFLRSQEFNARFSETLEALAYEQNNRFNDAPPMNVDLELNCAQERALWRHVANNWTLLGETEPFWSVLVNSEWKATEIGQSGRLAAFYGTGQNDLARMDRWFARNNVYPRGTGTCAEFGCGVGRCTVWLAKRFNRVIAFDISEPHLRLARARASEEGLKNIDFVLVRGKNDLNCLKRVDLFYSVIVLQHNPPPLMLAILDAAFASLNTNGVAFFQVPTYALDYSFRPREYLAEAAHGIEMHFLPQHRVLELAEVHRVRPLEISRDTMAGNFDRWISTTFLMKKREARWFWK